jgi:putative ABC transport system substrate-binding protein
MKPMHRRSFLTLLGGAVAAWPLTARAQQPGMPVVGYLQLGSSRRLIAPFLKGLSEMGFVEGRNVAIEYRFADDQIDRLPELAADLVRRRVAVIAAPSAPAALAAKAATTTIPIVFVTGGDPVALSLVASLNRPGAKRLQLLRELISNAAVFGVLADPANPVTPSLIPDLQAAARTLGLHLVVVNASTDSDLETALATFSQQHVGAVLVGSSNFYNRRTEQIAALAARHALPAIFQYREFALAGGLMSYGSSLGYFFRQAGIYTGRILNGDKPADLPVQQGTKIELVIN